MIRHDGDTAMTRLASPAVRPQRRAARSRAVVRCTGPGAEHVAEIAGGVPDPELPMISLSDLGVLRAVDVDEVTQAVTVTLTPTYSGCPALQTMATDVAERLAEAGYPGSEVRISLTDTWSSDDVTAAGRRSLHENGIAPPPVLGSAIKAQSAGSVIPDHGAEAEPVACPHCGAETTEQLSRFGATSCKALFRCLACREPFEHFKAH